MENRERGKRARGACDCILSHIRDSRDGYGSDFPNGWRKNERINEMGKFLLKNYKTIKDLHSSVGYDKISAL